MSPADVLEDLGTPLLPGEVRTERNEEHSGFITYCPPPGGEVPLGSVQVWGDKEKPGPSEI